MSLFQTLLLTASLVAMLPPWAAANEITKRPPIWEISDDDSSVFVAGSVHLLREKDMPIPPVFDKVYAASDEIVFEIDMAAMTDPSIAMKMLALGALPVGESLSDHFSEETMGKLRDYLSERNLPTGMFDRLSPGMVYLTLSSLEATRNGARPDLGLETQFFKKSREDEKPSRGLETPEYQMSRFNELEVAELENLISESLDDLDQAAEQLDKIITAWKTGDSALITELLLEQMEVGSAVREVLLTQRNKNWVPSIEESLAGEGTVLFLVGAAHLVGDDSVIDLLKEKGHAVTQLEFDY